MLPVSFSLVRARLRPASVLFLDWFGPRGLASIVLGLIFLEQEVSLSFGNTKVGAVAATVLLSIFAHGVSAVPGIKWYTKQVEKFDQTAPELLEIPPKDKSATGSWGSGQTMRPGLAIPLVGSAPNLVKYVRQPAGEDFPVKPRHHAGVRHTWSFPASPILDHINQCLANLLSIIRGKDNTVSGFSQQVSCCAMRNQCQDWFSCPQVLKYLSGQHCLAARTPADDQQQGICTQLVGNRIAVLDVSGELDHAIQTECLCHLTCLRSAAADKKDPYLVSSDTLVINCSPERSQERISILPVSIETAGVDQGEALVPCSGSGIQVICPVIPIWDDDKPVRWDFSIPGDELLPHRFAYHDDPVG
jgi:hypothetical protein